MSLALSSFMDTSVFARLRILDIDDIQPFEWGDATVEPFEASLIRHPFLVTGTGEEEGYLLLERTDEFRSLIASGVNHLPVQLCSDSELEVQIPRVGLAGFTEDELNRLASKHPEQIIIADQLEPQHEQQFWRTKFSFGDRPQLTVWLRNSSQSGCPYPLEFIFRMVEEMGRYHPIVGTHTDSCHLTRGAAYTATVELPSFGLGQLRKAALADRLFPPRIVRVVPSYRILHIDFPVSVLVSEMPLGEKENFLQELIGLREQSQKTSFYQGRIYLLNL